MQPKLEKLYTVSKNKTRSRLAQIMMVFPTRPFRYDLNQIPYDYAVEVRIRFKGLDLMDRVPDELWMEVRDVVQETGSKTIPKKKKCKKAKCLANNLQKQHCY